MMKNNDCCATTFHSWGRIWKLFKWANTCFCLLFCVCCQFSKGVFNGAGQILRQNGLLITYGVCSNSCFENIMPWKVASCHHDRISKFLMCFQVYAINGTITPSCNEHLDAELRQMWVGIYVTTLQLQQYVLVSLLALCAETWLV